MARKSAKKGTNHLTRFRRSQALVVGLLDILSVFLGVEKATDLLGVVRFVHTENAMRAWRKLGPRSREKYFQTDVVLAEAIERLRSLPSTTPERSKKPRLRTDAEKLVTLYARAKEALAIGDTKKVAALLNRARPLEERINPSRWPELHRTAKNN